MFWFYIGWYKRQPLWQSVSLKALGRGCEAAISGDGLHEAMVIYQGSHNGKKESCSLRTTFSVRPHSETGDTHASSYSGARQFSMIFDIWT